MIEINTRDLKTRKQQIIDGHLYTVRKVGNIEQLDLSQYMRRLNALAALEKGDKKLTTKQTQEVEQISEKISNIFVSLFDDGGDQSKSRALVSSLTDVELGLLIDQIFAESKPDAAEAPKE